MPPTGTGFAKSFECLPFSVYSHALELTSIPALLQPLGWGLLTCRDRVGSGSDG
jgi:hypothetical protein